mgnify:CR=1 FL=1
MKQIQIYDPPMCCSTGICGVDIDTELVRFASLLNQLTKEGIQVERYNLASDPMAFAQNPVVKELLEKEGDSALPVIFWDGQVQAQGRYPDKDERVEWVRAARETEKQIS